MKAGMRVLIPCVMALALPSVAVAATLDVCPAGCAYSTIQAAIDNAAPGDTIAVHHGTYAENLVVGKALTIRSAGPDERPVVMPAISGPTCAGGSLCAGASTVILVQADNVTIDGLVLDGDNPSLVSGAVVGGADIDARNGIITNHLLGVYSNLTVTNVTVKNMYLRGIYASSGGTFTFRHNVVRNVQAEYASIAMFNFGGSGVMTGNVVSDASDAISSNWSTGVKFLDNRIRRSGSGVHTDNAGANGGTADAIRGNVVRDCATDGFGIFVFAPYIAPAVEDNLVRGCAVGLAAFGQGAAVTTAFSRNRLDGHHAATSAGSDSIGVLVSTDLLSWGSASVGASFSQLEVTRFGTGVWVEQMCELYSGFYPSDCVGPSTSATATIHASTIVRNGVGANGLPGTTVNAEGNWWGCAEGPNHKGCDSAIGTVDFTPWLTRPAPPR